MVPLSVISSWMAEFRRWAPHLRIARVHGSDIAEKLRVRNEVRARLFSGRLTRSLPHCSPLPRLQSTTAPCPLLVNFCLCAVVLAVWKPAPAWHRAPVHLNSMQL